MLENPFERRGLGFPPHESKSESVIEDEVKELEEMSKLEEEKVDLVKVLKEHKGLESNIPINHPYWKVRGIK